MFLGNVFYGFTKDGEYRLLWKKFKTIWTSMGDVTTVVYYDLEKRCEFELSYVDTETLKPITDIVGDKKWMRRKKVKSVYKADADMLIDVKGAFYGDVIKKKILDNAHLFTNDLRKNILFARVNDPEGRSMEMRTGRLYSRAEHTLKGVCVRETHPIRTEHFDDVVAPKRKLLELDYKDKL